MPLGVHGYHSAPPPGSLDETGSEYAPRQGDVAYEQRYRDTANRVFKDRFDSYGHDRFSHRNQFRLPHYSHNLIPRKRLMLDTALWIVSLMQSDLGKPAATRTLPFPSETCLGTTTLCVGWRRERNKFRATRTARKPGFKSGPANPPSGRFPARRRRLGSRLRRRGSF